MFAQRKIGAMADPVSWGWLITLRAKLANNQVQLRNKTLSFMLKLYGTMWAKAAAYSQVVSKLLGPF